MPEFRFIGDPRCGGHGPDSIELFGHHFDREEWTTVEGDAAERCARHSHLKQREDEDASEAPKRRGRPPKARED